MMAFMVPKYILINNTDIMHANTFSTYGLKNKMVLST